jgi:hypothetical protein
MCGPYCFVHWAIRKFPLNDPVDKERPEVVVFADADK